MGYVMLPNLRVVLIFICLVVKRFTKVFICRLAMGSTVVYCTTIISNILNKVVNHMELRIVKDWLI